MNRWAGVLLAGPIILLLAGCTGGPSGDPTPTTGDSGPASPAVAVAPAPAQHSGGRRAVELDPCATLPDSVVSRAGFDPATRKRDDQIFDTYSFIGCAFEHRARVDGQLVTDRSLSVWSTNVTVDEFRSREGASATDLKIAGKDAVRYQKPNAESCYVALANADGTLHIRTGTNSPFTAERPCDRIQEVAELVAAALP